MLTIYELGQLGVGPNNSILSIIGADISQGNLAADCCVENGWGAKMR